MTFLSALGTFLGGVTTLITGLHGLSFLMPSSTLPSFVARLLTSYLALCACALYGVAASIVLRAVGLGGLSQWTTARAFKWTMRVTAGVEFVVLEWEGDRGEGKEGGQRALDETRPAVFVGNHQTELDVLMLGCIFPKYCSVTAKKSLKYMPFLGWFMALSKTVFIDRANRTTARAAVDSAAQHMRREKQSVFIFPEGTRSYATKPELLPFKKGAFHLAVQAQVPIVPIVVANYSDVLDVKKRTFRAGKIPVSVLPPIPTAGLTAADVDDLTKRTRDAMLAELVRLEQLKAGQHPVGVPATGAVPQAFSSAVETGTPKVRAEM